MKHDWGGQSVNGALIVLMAPRHETSWREFLAHYRSLDAENNRLQPCFLFLNASMSKKAGFCDENGLRYFDFFKFFVQRSASSHVFGAHSLNNPKSSQVLELTNEHVGPFSKFDLIHGAALCFNACRLYKRYEKELGIFLEDIDVHAALVPGDRELPPSITLNKVCKRRLIPVIIAQNFRPEFTSIAKLRLEQKPEIAYQYLLSNKMNRIVGWLFPSQVIEIQNQKIVFSPWWRFMALKFCGIASANPWRQASGLSDYIIVENEVKQQALLDMGVQPNKIVVTGSAQHDEIFFALKKKRALISQLIKSGKLNSKLKTIVFAVPQYHEHGMLSELEHQRYLNSVYTVLRGMNANVILSLHPKSQLNWYYDLANEYGFNIVSENLTELIGCADILLAGMGSTVLEWGAVIGIPSINHDPYRRNPNFSKYWNKVDTVIGMEELSIKLEVYLSDKVSKNRGDFTKRLTKYGFLDGKSGKRLATFLESLR